MEQNITSQSVDALDNTACKQTSTSVQILYDEWQKFWFVLSGEPGGDSSRMHSVRELNSQNDGEQKSIAKTVKWGGINYKSLAKSVLKAA